MIYLLFLAFSVFWWNFVKILRIQNRESMLMLSIPYICIWTLLIGTQYNVGSDYPTYIQIFNGYYLDLFDSSGEWIFTNIIRFSNHVGIYGQSLFAFFAFISISLMLFFINKVLNEKYLSLFFLIFIIVPGMFHNQMNGIRQYVAVYVLTVGVYYLFSSKWKWAFLYAFISMHIHASSIFAIIIICICYYCRNIEYKLFFYLCLVTSFIICIFFDAVSFIVKYIEYIPIYSQTHILYADFESRTMLNMITKLMYFPLFMYIISIIDKLKINKIQKQFYIIGILGYCIRIATLNITIVSRIGQYFEILFCIPIVFGLMHAKIYHRVIYFLTIVILLILYFIKVVIYPVGEYSYDSILLH